VIAVYLFLGYQDVSLVKDCYSMKLDLLTNATVVDDEIRFVSDVSKEKLKLCSSGEGDKEESTYDEYAGQLEED
jgi:hypothetical protein